jgi:uncharacterized protein (TIGR03083 family)
MSQPEKDRLIERLAATRAETVAALKPVNPNIIAHRPSGWLVKDVIGHLAAWDYEAAASLKAFAAGDCFEPQVDLEAFNQQAYQKRKKLSLTQVLKDFEAAHNDFKSALLSVPPDRLSGPMLFAWGATGTVNQMVEGMIIHEEEHRHEIKQAFRRYA